MRGNKPEPGSVAGFLRWPWLWVASFLFIVASVGAMVVIEHHPLAGRWDAVRVELAGRPVQESSEFLEISAFGEVYWDYYSICGQDRNGPPLTAQWKLQGQQLALTVDEDHDEHPKGSRIVLQRVAPDELAMSRYEPDGTSYRVVFERVANAETWLDALGL